MSENKPTLVQMLLRAVDDLTTEVQSVLAPRGIIIKEHKTKIDQLMVVPFGSNQPKDTLSRDDVQKKLKRLFPRITVDDIAAIEDTVKKKSHNGSLLKEDVAAWCMDDEWDLTFVTNSNTVCFTTTSKKKIEELEQRRGRIRRSR
jgi:hypothetical protein|tara:strand:+ start:4576 stop:5010 length:435 start_codon:yes stop_codon:yes gene_type:complete